MNIGRFALAFAALLVETLSISGGPKPMAPPRFQDYPATQAFEGTPVPPNIVTRSQRLYRTRIRNAVEKGWGVSDDHKEQNGPGPNFAGDMIFIRCSCGAPCLMAALVNARTGEVYDPPLAVNGTFGLPLLVIGDSVGRDPELEFRKDSRLMILSATPNWLKDHARSYRYYFVWQSKLWVLVYRESLD